MTGRVDPLSASKREAVTRVVNALADLPDFLEPELVDAVDVAGVQVLLAVRAAFGHGTDASALIRNVHASMYLAQESEMAVRKMRQRACPVKIVTSSTLPRTRFSTTSMWECCSILRASTTKARVTLPRQSI